LNTNFGEPPKPAWTGWRRERFLVHAGIRTPDRPALTLIVILTTECSELPKVLLNKTQINTGTKLYYIFHFFGGICNSPDNAAWNRSTMSGQYIGKDIEPSWLWPLRLAILAAY
jgi:hypothetical protein